MEDLFVYIKWSEAVQNPPQRIKYTTTLIKQQKNAFVVPWYTVRG